MRIRKTVRNIGIAREAGRVIVKRELNPYLHDQKEQLLTYKNKRIRLKRCRKRLKQTGTIESGSCFLRKSYSRWNNLTIVRTIGLSQQFFQSCLTRINIFRVLNLSWCKRFLCNMQNFFHFYRFLSQNQ